ncbi:MAG: hypothetical protein UT41_C0001G0542 [Candidatus Wolfebacteria bacterium GW2011_GWC2_39_22]|uniref:Uncharacterized protein n=1 Tax=Candidatus Wolfebacteria bacterium GW2011_GWC2_39_22 TaxID=1619013 RepID=A0A0G0NBW3_9BACT|nr:MAG: hypothetical protein UT41_C0001G0542 [Candidatus Wolfebacteria bacterium GW2011_GWC2_39_22]HBI25349.1 hypothetical protein [Candidatus Wolfebacteria bacterium]
MENTTQQTPEGWHAEAWESFNTKMKTMSKEELIKAFEDLDLVFEEPEALEAEDIISIADVLSEEDVRAYFKI